MTELFSFNLLLIALKIYLVYFLLMRLWHYFFFYEKTNGYFFSFKIFLFRWKRKIVLYLVRHTSPSLTYFYQICILYSECCRILKFSNPFKSKYINFRKIVTRIIPSFYQILLLYTFPYYLNAMFYCRLMEHSTKAHYI